MNRWLMNVWLAGIACGIVLSGFLAQAVAFDRHQELSCRGICVPDCVGAYSCDDYHRKCSPCVKPLKCFTCDDYCPKCAAGVKPVKCFTCPDFCRKPFRICCPRLR